MKSANLPTIVLFALAYVSFANVLWLRTSVFHYFFLDPRFKFVIPALVGLLTLLSGLHMVGRLALMAAAESFIAGAALVAAALCTCTFRDEALKNYTPVTASAAGDESTATTF